MQALKKTKLKSLKTSREVGPLGVIELLKKNKVVGRGGAGFPVYRKWKFAMDTDSDTKYLICNADEGEPGTFKDKFIFENNPETMIEGMIIAAETIGVKLAIIYLRGEYEYLREGLEDKIKKIIKKSKSKVSIEIVMGAGAYICGEETAIINSIAGRRGNPHIKPPFPAIRGLHSKPTVVNNVETFLNVSQSLSLSKYDNTLRLFSVSGSVKKPGIYELPDGTSLKHVLKLAKAKNPKAVYLGCFGGCIPIKNIKLQYKDLKKYGCHIGTYTLIVVGKETSIIDMALIIAKFFVYESCGKCTPCREGNIQVLKILKKIKSGEATEDDFTMLKTLSEHVMDTSLCGLGQTATTHVISAIKYFEKEFKKLLK